MEQKSGNLQKGNSRKNRYWEVLKGSYPKMSPADKTHFLKILRSDGLGDCKPTFHLLGFMFGWVYLLYRRATIESMGVLIISMLMIHLSPLLGLVTNSLIGGFCYHYLYLNKFARDLEICGEYNPDLKCMEQKGKPTILYPIGAIGLFLLIVIVELYPVWIGKGG